jgi:hypothetical protein
MRRVCLFAVFAMALFAGLAAVVVRAQPVSSYFQGPSSSSPSCSGSFVFTMSGCYFISTQLLGP